MTPEQRRAQEEADAAFARSLAEAEDAPAPAVAPGGGNFTIRAGQRAAIRLHHPSTRNHIGETFFANYVSSHEVMFELANAPGKHLRVTHEGRVDFAMETDNTTRFNFEVTPGSGNVSLSCIAHRERINTAGERTWYLALQRDGSLVGNAPRSQMAQWVLVAAGDVAAQPAPGLPSPTQSVQQLPAPGPAPAAMPYGRAPAAAATAAPHATSSGPSSGGGGGGIGSLFGWGGDNRGSYAMADAGNESEHHPSSSTELNPLITPPPPMSNSTAPRFTPGGPGGPQPPLPPPPPQWTPPTTAPRLAGPVAHLPPALILTASVDDQLLWLSSSEGQSWLDSLPSATAKNLLAAGQLRQFMYRPDWPWRVSDEAAQQRAAAVPRFDRGVASAALPENLQRRFFEDGFTVVRSAIPLEQIKAVSKLVSHWSQPTSSPVGGIPRGRLVSSQGGLGTGCRVELQGPVCKDAQVLSLYHGTPLVHVAQLLIGQDEVAPVTTSSIQLVYPSLEPEDADLPGAGPAGTEWTIEGFTEHGGHSPFTLLMAIPLTSMAEPHSGNPAPHGSSHIFLQEEFKAQVAAASTRWSEPGSAGKPVLPVPSPVLLERGDVLICSHKCAITYTQNQREELAKLIFLKLSHVDHEGGLKDCSLDYAWTEFKGADILDRGASTSTSSSSSSVGGSGTALLDFLSTPATNDTQPRRL